MREARAVRKPASAAPDRRERRKRATRQALLDAANSLLASRSLDSLSVDEIAMRADVGKGTFYNYFDDKDALERELSWYVRARMETEISRTNEGVSDPAERIARAFCYVLHFCLGAPEQAAAMMRLFPHATDPATPINSGVRGDVTEGLARGRIVASSEDVAVAYIVGVFMAGVNRALDLPSSKARTFAIGMGSILLHGLGISRSQAKRIMAQAVQSVLRRSGVRYGNQDTGYRLRKIQRSRSR
ncbi:MAG TPA: helix-turn-helix domain-containing protein [Candidatus Binataceae bacterium]|nr:helix-turn-helix domain-containing protein [Candidatus Binataceae bacterium]